MTTNPSSPGVSSTWRAATYFLLVVMAIAGAAGASMYEQFVAQVHDLQQKLQKTAQLQNVAVLLDDKNAPAMLVTLNAGAESLQLQRLNSVKEGREDTLQVWALPAQGSPRSLGILQSGIKTPQVKFSEQALTQVERLAISVEPKGGAPEGRGPSLPYLFSGAWVRKAL